MRSARVGRYYDVNRLESQNPQGVPVHPAGDDDSFIRSANGTIGQVVAIDAATGWIQVESAQRHVSVV
jgi:hypothetical protein